MKIKEITITSEASLKYQKVCASITAEVENSNDIETLRNFAIDESVKGIHQLVGALNVDSKDAKVEVKTNTTTKSPRAAANTYNNAPRAEVTQPNPNSYPAPEFKYSIGDIVMLDNVEYKLCQNKTNGDKFWAITDPNRIDANHTKYRKDFLGE